MNTTGTINPNDYYAALGRIVNAMNRLELDIRQTFPRVLGQETGTFLMALSATENFSRLMEIFRFAFRFKVGDKNLWRKLDPLYDRISKLNEERSRNVHSNWLFTMDNTRVIRYRIRKWPMGSEQDSNPDLQTLENFVNKLAEARNDLLQFLNEVFPATSTPPTNA